MNTSDYQHIRIEPFKRQYPEEVNENAKSYGYKASNLLYLGKKLEKGINQEISQSDKKITGKSVDLFRNQEDDKQLKGSTEPLIVSIPKPVCLSHDRILEHLNLKIPKWKEGWEKFVKAFNQQEDQSHLSSASAEILEKLAKKIKHAFDDIEIGDELGELLSKSGEEAIFMVRSTGPEDSPDIVNPGGNKSVPSRSDKKSLSQSIGRVVGSYFGKKSIEQRLKANDDITKDPFMPVLIQPLIGEGINGNAMVYSGVMYSGEGETRIQAAPGHGELIVNSKGNFDNFYITSNQMVYSEVQNKKFRIKPIFNEGKHKLSLVKEENPQEIALFERLDEKVIQEMHKVAQQIENLYKMRMDIEFVYTPSSNTLHIVQARALPEGDRANHSPSALDPHYLGKIVEEGGKKFEGRTITPDLNHAVIIENSKEMIVCDTIEEALQIYLSSDKINAVVIRRNAPDTSHEAGVFTSKAIPVIQIRQIDQIENVVEELKNGRKLVIDPQRKSVFQLPQNLEASSLIKEGFFKSSLTSHVTSYPHRFEQRIEGSSEIEIEQVEEPRLLGDLFLAAKRGEPKAQKELFSLVWETFLKGNELTPSYKDLKSALKVLEDVYQEPSQLTEALRTVVKSVSLLYKKKKISFEVFVQVVISSLELHQNIKALSSSSGHLEYLNVIEKLRGTILGEGEEDVLAHSMKIDLKETSHMKKAMEKIQGRHWSKEQKESFSQAIKLTSFFIGETGKKEWIDFCKNVCDKEEYAPRLVALAGTLVKLGIQAQWCNISFLKIYEENEQEPAKTLQAILKELKPILLQKKNFAEIEQSIDELRKQLPNWKNPKNFEKLHKQLQETLKLIGKKLVFSDKDPLLKQMLISKLMQDFVEVFDLSTKSLKISTFYDDQYQQAANFKVLVCDFYQLMKEWMVMTNSSCPPIISFLDRKLLGKTEDRYYLEQLSVYGKPIGIKPSPKDLSVSGSFDARSATIHSRYDEIGWSITLSHCITLEDCLTVLHQNFLLLTNRVFSESSKIFKNSCPDLVRDIDLVFSNELKIGNETTAGSLSGISFSHPKISFHYNVPLRNHSSRIDVLYDYSKNKIRVSYRAFGANEGNRWTNLAFKSFLRFILLDIKQVKFPNFEPATKAFAFEVEIKNHKDLNILKEMIDEIHHDTFRVITSHGLEKTKVDLEQYETTHLNRVWNEINKWKNKGNMPEISEWIEIELLPLSLELEKRKEGFDSIEFIHEHPEMIITQNLYENEKLMLELVDKYGLQHAMAMKLFGPKKIFLRFIQVFKGEEKELSQKQLEEVLSFLKEDLLEEQDLSMILSNFSKTEISYLLEKEMKKKRQPWDDNEFLVDALTLALKKFNK